MTTITKRLDRERELLQQNLEDEAHHLGRDFDVLDVLWEAAQDAIPDIVAPTYDQQDDLGLLDEPGVFALVNLTQRAVMYRLLQRFMEIEFTDLEREFSNQLLPAGS